MMRNLILAVVAASVLSASADYKYQYFWTGATSSLIQEPSNWNDANGNPCTRYSMSECAFYFDNTAPLTLTANDQLYADGYHFRGSADVTFPRNTFNMRTTSGSGGIYHTGTGTAYFDYTVTFPVGLGDYPIETAADSTVYLSSYGTTTINTGVRVIKRGPGKLQTGKNVWEGTARLEGGTWYCSNNNSTFGATNRLEVAGSDEKTLSFYNNIAASFASYAEEETAGDTMLFQIYTSSDATLTLKGAADSVTRFASDFYNRGNGTYQLVWDPACAARLDVVRRVYNQSKSKIFVKSGVARFAEGAGVTKLKEIRIGAGASLELMADAGSIDTGASMVVDDGARLVVGRQYTPCDYLTWNGTVELTGGRFYNAGSSLSGAATIGANADLEVSGAATKEFYCYGNKDTVIRNYTEAADAAETMTFRVYTSSSPKFTIRGTRDTRLTATVCDDVGGGTYTVAWNPPDAAQVLTLAKHRWNVSNGGFRAETGLIRFAEGASFAKGFFSVASGAKVGFAADAGDVSGLPLVLETGAKVVVEPGACAKVKSLSIGGAAVDAGVYTAADVDWLEGAGMLAVGDGTPREPETVAARWTGGAESTSIAEAGNWGGTLPNLTDGSLVATFPADAKVSVTSGCWLKGVVAEGALEIAGEEELTLGSVGLVAGAGAAVTNGCPIAFRTPSTVTAAAGGEIVFTPTGVLSSFWPLSGSRLFPLAFAGDGVIHIHSTNPGLGDTTLQAKVHLHADNAVGAAGALATCETMDKAYYLYGNAFDNDFLVTASSRGTAQVLFYVMHGTNVFNGLVRCAASNSAWWMFDNGDTKSKMVFAGGYEDENVNKNALFTPIHRGTMEVEQVPMAATKLMIGYANLYSGVLNLNVASNVTTRGLVLVNGSELNANVKDALFATDDGASGVILNNESTWNLRADQGVNLLASPVGSAASVVSDCGATLTLRDDRLNSLNLNEDEYWSGNGRSWLGSFKAESAKTNAAAFKGDVSVVKRGALDHVLTGRSTSTGTLAVEKGRLVFAAGGSWKTLSALTIGENGTVEVAADTANPFSNRLPIAVTATDPNGRIVVPAGRRISCASLTVNGEPLAEGEYADGVVTGGGRLRVGRVGLLLLVR